MGVIKGKARSLVSSSSGLLFRELRLSYHNMGI